MFIEPGRLLHCWAGFAPAQQERRDALSRLAARDCIQSVLVRRHPSVDRLAVAVRAIDGRLRHHIPDVDVESPHWWWAGSPPPPAEPPRLGSVAASEAAAGIWEVATEAGLSPFDRLTFRSAEADDVIGHLRFQVVTVEPLVVRPWIDFVLVPVERTYYKLLGAAPPEVFTATISVAVGRLRPVGIHLLSKDGYGAVREATARYIEAFFDILAGASPSYLMEDLLRQSRFASGAHADWRLPISLMVYGHPREARQALNVLVDKASGRPYSRRFHELQWLARNLL